MRGKRDFENGLYEDYNDQVYQKLHRSTTDELLCFEEELNLLSELVKRGGRAPGAGFVGMRG